MPIPDAMEMDDGGFDRRRGIFGYRGLRGRRERDEYRGRRPDGAARGGDNVAQSCTVPGQCYPNVAEGGSVNGTVVCLDRVPNGDCTHECQTDADCCAVPGECLTKAKQLCAPFESTGKTMCLF